MFVIPDCLGILGILSIPDFLGTRGIPDFLGIPDYLGIPDFLDILVL
jgi:hypothetical protein